MEKVTIRKGTSADNLSVENVTREAFWNLYKPGCDEHYTIHTIWTHKDFIPELYYVAVLENEIVGAIVYTRSYLESDKGGRFETVTFGPVCVLPEYQYRGIGTQLINVSMDKSQEHGYLAVVILGDPHNYCRHGFRNTKDHGIADSRGKYPLGQMIKVLNREGMPDDKTKFFYSDAYEIDMDKVEEFDSKFPVKEKKGQWSQDLFNMLIRSYIE